MGMKLRRPELELDLTMGSNQMLLDMLEDDALDAILIATNEGEFNNTAFDVVPLFEDDIFSPPRRRSSWMPHNSPTCAITPIASLCRWRRGSPPMPDFGKHSISLVSSRRSSPG